MSHEAQGLETLPTIHEGFVARQMQQEGKESERIQINQERKEYNKTIIELAEAKKEKRIKERTDKFVRRFTPIEKKQLRETAKSLRFFVNYENISTRRQQLDKWKSRLDFSPDSVDKMKKMNRIERETELLNQAELILEQEANRFLDKYYPSLHNEELSKEQKIELVDVTVTQNKPLSMDEVEHILHRLEKKQMERDLHVLLNNRPQFVFFLQKEIQHAEKKFQHLRMKNGINFEEVSTIQNASEKELSQMKGWLNQKEKLKQSLELMEQLYDQQLHDMYPNWDGRKYLTLEEKECFVVAEEILRETDDT